MPSGTSVFLRFITCPLQAIEEFSGWSDVRTASNVGAPSLERFWLLAFLRNYGDSRSILLATTSCGGATNFVAPFVKRGQSELELLCDETSDYNDVFCSRLLDTSLKTVLEGIWPLGVKSVRFTQLASDSITIEALRKIASETNVHFEIKDCNVLPVVLPNDAPVWMWSGAQASVIKRYAKKLRRLQQGGSVEFAKIENKSSFEDIFPTMVRMHIQRWNNLGIRSKFLDPRRVSFTREICEQALRQNKLLIHAMRFNGKLVAYNLGFLGDGTLYDWVGSFDIQNPELSPGSLLQLRTFQDFRQLNFCRYNFLKGDEAYKFIWTKEVEVTKTITLSKGYKNTTVAPSHSIR